MVVAVILDVAGEGSGAAAGEAVAEVGTTTGEGRAAVGGVAGTDEEDDSAGLFSARRDPCESIAALLLKG